MLERLLETISFEATDRDGDTVSVDKSYVDEHLEELTENENFARFIL
jgi:ATP-dependent HslUV protease ATP-binding subunit HslU